MDEGEMMEAYGDGNGVPALFLSDGDVQCYQNQLWELLKELTYGFTMGDSSSLPVETANELVKSAVFCIGLYLKSRGESLAHYAPIAPGTVAKLFSGGRQTVFDQIERGKAQWQAAIDTAPPVDSISYWDTLREIGGFFRRYDAKYLAHEIPCAIDYPLCHAVPERYGIAYVREYLRRLQLENALCARFSIDSVRQLLACHWPTYREDLINICEPVFINAMGLCLIGKDVFSLSMTGTDKTDLFARFGSWSADAAKQHMQNALHRLLDALGLHGGCAHSYFAHSANDLFVRMASLGFDGFFNLFVTLDG